MEFVILISILSLLSLIAAGYLIIGAFSKIKGLFCSRQMQKSSLNYPLFRR
jgi:hypothetical protein